MRILALETSTRQASIAVTTDEEEILERRMPAGDRTAVWLADAIGQLLSETGSRNAIQLLALTSGPGSFTGLRIGVTTAKMLAYAWGVPICALDTLNILAAQAAGHAHDGRLTVALDAQRNDLFAADFECAGGRLSRTLAATRVVSARDWVNDLASQPTSVSGLALGKLQGDLPQSAHVIDSSLWTPLASTVAATARTTELRVTAAELLPNYHRQSYAERSSS